MQGRPGAEETAAQPDLGLVTAPLVARMPDRGPRYTETPPDQRAPDAPFVAEPWNAVTASFFVWIMVAWVWRLRGRYRDFPFLVCCLPILLVGGIGGTLYHAFRSHALYFYLDVIPISVLGVAGGVFMAMKAWGRAGWWYLLGGTLAYLGFSGLFFVVIAPLPVVARLARDPTAVAVNASYAALAMVVLTPLVWSLVKTRFRHVGWVVAGLVSFALAWTFRLVDRNIGSTLPMGSHWLWHTFGAITTGLVIEYFYRVEGETKPPPSPALPSTDKP